ncbi:hypothetical protein KAH94_06415, partial [bacterium]|nr:hypothetical protein [bacterium]
LIDMSTPQKGLRSLVKAINMIKGKKRHAIVFPEGARFIGDNSVREFFSGFAMLAKQAKRSVVPVMIFDAYKVYPPGSFFVHKHPVKVVVGKPFHFQKDETLEAFKNRVYAWFVKQVDDSEK